MNVKENVLTAEMINQIRMNLLNDEPKEKSGRRVTFIRMKVKFDRRFTLNFNAKNYVVKNYYPYKS